MKRIFSFVLAIAMIFSMSAFTINAAPVETDYNDAASHLAALNILKGDGKGNMMLDQNVTRYQAALFFVQALTGKTEVEIWNADKNSTIFSDVTEYGTAIDYAYGVKLILGRGNGVYGPNDYITYQDMLVMAVRALGYETAGMTYPYGYILAAQKLGLTDDIDIVNYKTDLNRGATAQIMWNMLNTEVAYVDPLTNKVLYPGETGLTDTVTETTVTRKTLLEDSGLAGGKLTGTIVSYNEAEDEDEVDTITVKIDNVEYVIAASDMKIDATIPKVAYMGLSADIYVSVDVEDFTQDAYDDGDAKVIFASYPTYTSVSNFDGENIKYINATKPYYTFNGVKFNAADTNITVMTFDGTWTEDTSIALDTIFAYDSKDGYITYPYATISYRVIDESNVEVLYVPYTFGRYNVHNINDVNYTVIGSEGDLTKNYAGEESVFVEKLLGTDKVVNADTKTISNKNGELAASVKTVGEAVTAGDFVYYNYNETDNILTIGMNCDNFQTGRLTSYSDSKDTVKIDGVIYSVENVNFDNEVYTTYINALEAGKDNAKFIVVNGEITYITICNEVSDDNIFDFAVISQDEDVIKSLLEDEDDYATVEGVYYDNGVKVAMMNFTTGAWELVSIAGFATDYTDDEFNKTYNVSEIAKFMDTLGTHKDSAILTDFAALKGIVAVVDTNKDGYVIAAGDDNYFTTGTAENGLIFSDNNNKTNAITADDENEPARVSVDDDTVIVVINSNGDIGSRVGIQGADNSINAAGTFYAASSNLIVLVTDTDFDVTEWKDAEVSNSDENWYITTIDTNVEVSVDDEDVYTFIIYNVFDMRTHEIVNVTVEGETASDVKITETAGNVIHMDKYGKITDNVDLINAMTLIANDKDVAYTNINASDIDFVNGDTIAIGDINANEAVDINATIITLFNFDITDYDIKGVASTTEHTNDGDNNDVVIGDKSYYDYAIDTGLVNIITEPDDAIFSNYAVKYANVQIPTVEDDDVYVNATVEFNVIYFAEDGVVDIIVYKIISLD